STTGLDGSRRFVDRAWREVVDTDDTLSTKLTDDSNELDKTYHETVKKVTHDFKHLHFNTGISQLMMLVTAAYKGENLNRHYIEGFVKLLSPVAPHLAEELWERLGYQETIAYESWPTYDESKLVETEVEIVIQV